MVFVLLLVVIVLVGLGTRSVLPHQKPASRAAAWVWARERRSAWLLVPVAILGASFQASFPWLILFAFLLVVFTPAAATRLVPWALLGYGAAGFFMQRSGAPGSHYGLLPGFGFTILPSPWALPQAAGFLAAGAWLFSRLDAPGSGALRALLGRLRDAEGPGPWALLLLPVLGVIMELSGFHSWFGLPLWAPDVTVMADLATGAAALVLILRRPRIAATAALVGLVFLGAYGIMLAAFWPAVTGGYYAAMVVDDHATALFGGSMQGAALLAVAGWLAPRMYGGAADPELRARAERLTERVETLTQTRTDAVDSAAAELRRIERDLHDGAQARLVALGMSLRAAERLFSSNPEAALALVSEAKDTSSRALAELRDLVRGIYPPVLADRGLGDAVKALALDSPLHTVVEVDIPGEIDTPVGSAVYFAVAEALANAAKHSGARTVRIHLGHHAGVLRAEVTDDGAGGADQAQGTGLAGVERRLATFDGILAVSSPPGGPTIIVIEVPCALSSPKTSSC